MSAAQDARAAELLADYREAYRTSSAAHRSDLTARSAAMASLHRPGGVLETLAELSGAPLTFERRYAALVLIQQHAEGAERAGTLAALLGVWRSEGAPAREALVYGLDGTTARHTFDGPVPDLLALARFWIGGDVAARSGEDFPGLTPGVPVLLALEDYRFPANIAATRALDGEVLRGPVVVLCGFPADEV